VAEGAKAGCKTWFITGASKGLGRQWTIAALERGDRVAVAARNVDLLEELASEYGRAVLPVALDVRDREAAFAAVAQAREHFGRIDVVVNNAGSAHFGHVEEFTEQEARALMDTNFFGALWVTQAALSVLREQGHGHVLQVSSIGGLGGSPYLGLYAASKAALEGLSESLAQEVKEFGIKVTIIEPGGYRTGRVADAPHTDPHPAYEGHLRRHAEMAAVMESRSGDPEATRAAILQVVDSENPPLRLLLGEGTLNMLANAYESRLAVWRSWEAVSVAAQGSLSS
jgi:NAD(P)-dependent dehydrogenase (short-subunit alcohol dehydrogenase family)